MAEAFVRPAGTKVLFVVDDAQLLDERSAQVLLQLAADAHATVLATARDLELPEGVERLWRDGWCERIELGALTDDEVWSSSRPCSARPSTRPRRAHLPAEPRAIRCCCANWSAPHWTPRPWYGVALPGRWPANRRSAAASASWSGPGWRRLPDAQRVRTGNGGGRGTARDRGVTELVGETVLDELDADRLISVRAGLAGPEVSSAHPLQGEVLRADIPPLRLRRLRLSLASKLEAIEHPSPHDLVRAALWRLESGLDRRPRAAAGRRSSRPEPEPRHGRTAGPARARGERLAAGHPAARRDPHPRRPQRGGDETDRGAAAGLADPGRSGGAGVLRRDGAGTDDRRRGGRGRSGGRGDRR